MLAKLTHMTIQTSVYLFYTTTTPPIKPFSSCLIYYITAYITPILEKFFFPDHYFVWIPKKKKEFIQSFRGYSLIFVKIFIGRSNVQFW